MAVWRSSAAGTPGIVVAAILMLTPAGASPQDSSKPASTTPLRETLDYAVEWRLIPAGTAKFTWTPLPRPAVAAGPAVNPAVSEVRLHLESAGLVSRLFYVSNDYTAMLGQNFCVQNTFLAAHEGSRNRETRVVYDAQAHKASYVEKDLVKNATSAHEVDIPACVHDVIGGLMVLRNLNLEPGKTAQIPLSDGKKFVQAKVESQRREELKTDLGTVKTILYEIFLFDNVFYKRPGHLHIWLTDDERHLPVQIQTRFQFAIGTITLRLQKPGAEGG